MAPVELTGRSLEGGFWSKAWCKNLDQYAGLGGSLEVARQYVSEGLIIDLQIEPGRVKALVQGTDQYEVDLSITAMSRSAWSALIEACEGRITCEDALFDAALDEESYRLLAGSRCGLYPTPEELKVRCSCPNWTGFCEHAAAALFGVAVRLDEDPGTLFRLRRVDPSELIRSSSNLALVPKPLEETVPTSPPSPEDLAPTPPAATSREGTPSPRSSPPHEERVFEPPKPRGEAPSPASSSPLPPEPASPPSHGTPSPEPSPQGSGGESPFSILFGETGSSSPSRGTVASPRAAARSWPCPMPAKDSQQPASDKPSLRIVGQDVPVEPDPLPRRRRRRKGLPGSAPPRARKRSHERAYPSEETDPGLNGSHPPSGFTGDGPLGDGRPSVITARQLSALGVPRAVHKRWLSEGIIVVTARKGIFKTTTKSAERLEQELRARGHLKGKLPGPVWTLLDHI